ncbi:UDP-N-acetylmuramate dehydrogenase [Parvimonas micra]|uniref:UDP-N-acetylenolpyruvoylglucosamine reductase n=1 Tax=Parvimonas micra TaxID=33033 RepID=A0A9X3K7R7_9FIRM|nr:UDP-N-acetylmuramate dehydrogenase [Parvimonas micra]MCZ7407805.1 UDP-N-acetylmuramate dehydrogenase [Parvimonas micra]MCZ7410800.1 UDP-N-acetylmuramate dehydrogenase [Parvimonas micra]MCZ7412478.1 UDP-N-acetylmuramate dehydrogenase [Parvimonas micra]WBB36461.1 UDP-N-acetylmuramate dehydrogenase [Parvimonas micra]
MLFSKLNCIVRYDEPLKNHTTFKIGGNCIALIEPREVSDIVETIKICRENSIKFFVIGNGSNLLVPDEGYNGVIIKLKSEFSTIQVEDEYLIVNSGAKLSEVYTVAYENSLTGFEFASGIPGTIGGAIYMNAGAYGGEMKDIVESVEVLDLDNFELRELKNEELEFSYRKSIIQRRNYIVTTIKLKLQKGNKEKINAVYEDLRERRNSKQPLNFGSAGSTFKRPEGHFASKLIEDAGLKGYHINDAWVSEKHSGFVVNKGNASYKEVMELIEYVQKVVFEKFGVKLETEVRILKD